MTFKEIFKAKSTEAELERERLVSQFRNSLVDVVIFAREQLPVIEKALAEADQWILKNLGGIPAQNIPNNVGKLLDEIDTSRNVPNAIRQALNEYDHMTAAQLWGYRPDGQRDINRLANVLGGIKGTLMQARGRVKRIGEIVQQLKSEQARIENLDTPASLVETVTLNVPSPEPAAKVAVAPRIDVRVR